MVVVLVIYFILSWMLLPNHYPRDNMAWRRNVEYCNHYIMLTHVDS